MIGLIFKVFFGIAVLISGALLALNVTNVWNPGTLSVTAPDVDACRRYAATYLRDRHIELVEVRWIWTARNYGWGCYFEFGEFDVMTVTPMPK